MSILLRMPVDNMICVSRFLNIAEAVRLRTCCRPFHEQLMTLPELLVEQDPDKKTTLQEARQLLAANRVVVCRADVETNWGNKLRPQFHLTLENVNYVIFEKQIFFRMTITQHLNPSNNLRSTLAFSKSQYLPSSLLDKQTQIFMRLPDQSIMVTIFKKMIVLPSSISKISLFPMLNPNNSVERLTEIFYLPENWKWANFIVEVKEVLPSSSRKLIFEYAAP